MLRAGRGKRSLKATAPWEDLGRIWEDLGGSERVWGGSEGESPEGESPEGACRRLRAQGAAEPPVSAAAGHDPGGWDGFEEEDGPEGGAGGAARGDGGGADEAALDTAWVDEP